MRALRSGTLGPVRLDDLDGLITFPSFHATAVLLFTWAVWPLGRLRWAALALNLLVIATVPIDGAHYFVDVLGGAGVTALSLVTARRLYRSGPSFLVPMLRPAPAWPRPRTAPR